MKNNATPNPPVQPVVGKLFTLITFRLEDVHESSVVGHCQSSIDAATSSLNSIQSATEEIAILCDAIQALLDHEAA